MFQVMQRSLRHPSDSWSSQSAERQVTAASLSRDLRAARLSRWFPAGLTLTAWLDGDVVFAMSQGSKELFHSNMLGWYLRRFPFLRETLLGAGRRNRPVRRISRAAS